MKNQLSIEKENKASKGDNVWVWHYESLKEVEVTEVTEISGRMAIIYSGFATIHFFATRNEAVEHRLGVLCSMAKSLKDKRSDRENIIKQLINLAEQTQVSVGI